jgi:signal peptidase I
MYNKRIIGCPGDKIQITNGVLIINGKTVQLEYEGEYSIIENEKIVTGECYTETLPNGHKHRVLYNYKLGHGSFDNSEEFTVPEGHYFMMGDHRQSSLDSRLLIGYIKENNIVGKVVMIAVSNGNVNVLNITKLINSMRLKDFFRFVV